MFVSRRRFVALVAGLLNDYPYADGMYGMRMAGLVGEVQEGCSTCEALKDIISDKLMPMRVEQDPLLQTGLCGARNIGRRAMVGLSLSRSW